MGRPKSNNPKTEHLGFATTKERKEKFNSLNLKGDAFIDILWHYLGNENKDLQISKITTINRIKEIDKSINELEFERFKLEQELDDINKQIGLAENGYNIDVQKAIDTILQRFNNQSTLNILEFLKYNEDLLKQQAFLCGIDYNKLGDLVFDKV